MLKTAAGDAAARARKALALIAISRDTASLGRCGPLLYPAEYRVRADALVEARRLVGGVVIEENP